MGPCLSPRERRTAGSSCFQKDPSHVNTEQEGWAVVFYLGRNEYDCWNFSYSDNSHHKQAALLVGLLGWELKWLLSMGLHLCPGAAMAWANISHTLLSYTSSHSRAILTLCISPPLKIFCLWLSPFVLSSQMFFNITSFLFLYLYSCHTL